MVDDKQHENIGRNDNVLRISCCFSFDVFVFWPSENWFCSNMFVMQINKYLTKLCAHKAEKEH